MLRQIVAFVAQSKLVQMLLEKNLEVTTFLMGMGSGSFVGLSGELAAVKLLCSLKPPPYTVFDVGANKGEYTASVVSTLPGGTYQVHCFEPGRAAFCELEARFREHAQIVLNNVALSATAGVAQLYYDYPGSALASLTKRDLAHKGISLGQAENVQVNTLTRYCEERRITAIDLLKLDVEGYEMSVLEGALELFERGIITLVTFEFGGADIDTRTFFRDFYKFFRKQQMQVYRITPGGTLVPLPSYREGYEQFRTTNFLAIREAT